MNWGTKAHQRPHKVFIQLQTDEVKISGFQQVECHRFKTRWPQGRFAAESRLKIDHSSGDLYARDVLVLRTIVFHVKGVTWAQQIKDPSQADKLFKLLTIP